MTSVAFSPSVHRLTAPPTTSLDSPKKTSPIMLLSSGGRSTQGNKSLALMWPSEGEDDSHHSLSPVSASIKTNLGGSVVSNTHEHNSIDLDSPYGKGTLSLDKTAEVLVCPSGQTVVRVKASMEAILHSPSNKRSPSGIKCLLLPYSQEGTPQNRSKPGGPRDSPWPHSGVSNASSMSFPGRSLLFDSSDKPYSGTHPSPARSPIPTRNVSSGGDTPLPSPGLLAKKKGPRRRKISGKDKGDKTRFIGGAQGILEQDHPEEDVSNHSRCPCFKFFLLVCLVVVFLAILFYLSLWLVAQHRGSPVIVAGGENLQTVLQTQVFGQPLVVSILPQLLSGFLANDTKERTMVLMFQGQSGTGKTFVANLIQSKLFSEQAQQKCTKKFLPLYLQVKEHLMSAYDYSIALEDFIDEGRSSYRTCPLVVYIIEDLDFDESSNLLEALAFTLKSVCKRQASQEQKMAFVLMSNLQEVAVGQYVKDQIQKNIRREDISLEDITPILKAFPSIERTSDKIDLKQDQSIEGLKEIHANLLSVVDHHIPFFPLEREHVILCIRQTLTDKNVTLNDVDIEWIADKLSYYPEKSPVFSSSGCKKVEEKANLFSKYTQS